MNTGEGGSKSDSTWKADATWCILDRHSEVRCTRFGRQAKRRRKLREVAAHETVRMFEVKLAQGAKAR